MRPAPEPSVCGLCPQAHKILQEVAAMRQRRQELESKNALLRRISRETGSTADHTVDAEGLASEWDALLAGLTQFEQKLDMQKGELAKQVDSNVARFLQRVEAVRSKWMEIKPGGTLSSAPCSVIHG